MEGAQEMYAFSSSTFPLFSYAMIDLYWEFGEKYWSKKEEEEEKILILFTDQYWIKIWNNFNCISTNSPFSSVSQIP